MKVWKAIAGFEGRYEVSSHGDVRNSSSGLVLALRLDKDGYAIVNLGRSRPGANSTRKVHRLVAGAFEGNTAQKAQVNHKNGNRAENLEWVSMSENHLHAYRELGRAVGNERKVVAVCGAKTLTFASVLEAARAGFNRKGIHHCLSGAYRQHKGFTWSYAS